MKETPHIVGSAYSMSTIAPEQFLSAAGQARMGWPGEAQQALQRQDKLQGSIDALRRIEDYNKPVVKTPQPIPKAPPVMTTVRIVKVFIADTNENLPLDKRVLHSGNEQLTDLTDQELFFEVPIADLLRKHNEVRAGTLDKPATAKAGRDVYLEHVRIRDLKMVVVTVAAF